jgi:fatty-acyl-CoA synthase
MIQGPSAPSVKFSTLHEVLAAAAGTEHGLTFVGMQEETWLPYREVYRRARRAAHVLIELGIRPLDRVAIVMPTSSRFMDAFFGTVLAGAVPAPLYPCPRVGRKDDYDACITHMLRAIGTRLILADAPTRITLEAAVEAVRPELGCRVVEELSLDTSREEAQVVVDPEALGLIQFSSGSTSSPKGVALSHSSLVAQLAMLDMVLGEDRIPTDKMVTWLPLYHDFGLIGCLLMSIYMQIPIVMMAPDIFIIRPHSWLRAISRHRGTLTAAPNFAYELCMRRIPESELAKLELHTLRHALNGAEPVSATLMQAFSQRFARCGLRQRGVLCPVYGLAEATLAVTHTTRERSRVRWLDVDAGVLAREGRVVEGTRRLTSVGIPMPGVDIQIRDDAGDDLPERKVGRIFVKSLSAMQGYFAAPEATAEVLSGEWLDTGDLGFEDQGELFITGRIKDLVIIRGANYSAETFEDCVAGLEVLRPGWVVAAGFVPEDSVNEELLILAERNESLGANDSADDSAAMRAIRQTILEATGVRAHTILMLPKGTLRRTSSGKIRRRDALDRFLAGDLTTSQTSDPQSSC